MTSRAGSRVAARNPAAAISRMQSTLGSTSNGGVPFAVAAGAGWGAYIVCGAVAGKHTAGHDGLASAMGLGALLA
ncbi:hypothetical protein [Nocardia niwae]|uniref:Uncharacterized protein n=1 Tax=Nocardia niwae TaxID=626084 RepID=A0ABV2X3M4_9NOCA